MSFPYGSAGLNSYVGISLDISFMFCVQCSVYSTTKEVVFVSAPFIFYSRHRAAVVVFFWYESNLCLFSSYFWSPFINNSHTQNLTSTNNTKENKRVRCFYNFIFVVAVLCPVLYILFSSIPWSFSHLSIVHTKQFLLWFRWLSLIVSLCCELLPRISTTIVPAEYLIIHGNHANEVERLYI